MEIISPERTTGNDYLPVVIRAVDREGATNTM